MALINTTPVQVLLVEDSPYDAELMIEALREGNLDIRVSVVEDGEEAMRFLRQQDSYETSPRPDLILLDLHLPRKSGHEVLADIKDDSVLRRIPVIIMTSSDDERAFIVAYDLHANCCVSKPVDPDEYALAVKTIETFWLSVAQRARWS
jgi:CheY-like chemotaxis protein